MKIIFLTTAILTFFIFSGITVYAEDMVIIYPKFQSEKDTRYLEQVELLETAMKKTEKKYGKYKLQQSDLLMNELRYVVEAKRGELINVIWWSTNPQVEKDLIPIRIPISKGILGYRIFIINRADKDNFAKIKTIEDLRKYQVGQGADWGDVKVFFPSACQS